MNKLEKLQQYKYDKKNYKRLLVTAYMKSNPVINGYLYLDGILSHARLKQYLGKDFYNLPETNERYDIDLPLLVKDKCFLSSFAIYKGIEYTDRWRKRFQTTRALKWKDYKKVHLNRGQFKNYDMPIPKVALEKIEWVCIGDKDKIGNLLKEIIWIGKKGSQGHGIVESFEIKETKKKGFRHFPIEKVDSKKDIEYTSWRPPYNLEFTTCIIKKI